MSKNKNENKNETKTVVLRQKQAEAYDLLKRGKSIFLTGPAGSGKCLGENTPVLMYDMTIKMSQNITTKDILMGDDGSPRKVLSTVKGQDYMYRVVPDITNDAYTINSKHIVTLYSVRKVEQKGHSRYEASWGNKEGNVERKYYKTRKDANEHIELLPSIIDLPIIKCWMKDREWHDYFLGCYAEFNYPENTVGKVPYHMGKDIAINSSLIPLNYIRNSRSVRLFLLRGIMDTCVINKDKYPGMHTITFKNNELLHQILILVRSLGLDGFVNKNSISIFGYTEILSSNVRKYISTFNKLPDYTYVFKVERCGTGDYFGFTVDKNQRFVLGNMIVTHNSSVIKKFMKEQQYNRAIAITSTTGTSALLIGGTTMHSYLGIGLGRDSVKKLSEKILKFTPYRKRWQDLDTLIIDEVSMLSPALFDKLEAVARIVRQNELPFGGIQLVLSGDFLQLPVIGSDTFCFASKSWETCVPHISYLDEIIRQSDPIFQDCLNNIRLGKCPDYVQEILNKRVGIELKNGYGIKPTKLFSLNYKVNEINDKELDLLAEDDREFNEYTMIIDTCSNIRNKSRTIEKFVKNCTTPEVLQLCVGAQVMLTKNLDMENKLANGSRGVVTKFVNDIPMVRFLNGGEHLINHYLWEVEENGRKILFATQIPLKIAYALSIHISQGCSLDYVEIDLSEVFEYGQAYVALSRVKTLEGLSIIDVNWQKIKAHPQALAYYKKLSDEKLSDEK